MRCACARVVVLGLGAVCLGLVGEVPMRKCTSFPRRPLAVAGRKLMSRAFIGLLPDAVRGAHGRYFGLLCGRIPHKRIRARFAHHKRVCALQAHGIAKLAGKIFRGEIKA